MEKQLYCGRCHKKAPISDIKYVQTPDERLILVCSACRAHVKKTQPKHTSW